MTDVMRCFGGPGPGLPSRPCHAAPRLRQKDAPAAEFKSIDLQRSKEQGRLRWILPVTSGNTNDFDASLENHQHWFVGSMYLCRIPCPQSPLKMLKI